MSRRYRKSDIDTHYDHGRSLPAFNVKVYATCDDATAKRVATDNGYDPTQFMEWLRTAYASDTGYEEDWECPEWAWNSACEGESEYFQEWLPELLGRDDIKSWHEGRQGGWLVVDGLPDIDSWDAIMVNRWGKAERIAKEIASHIPYHALSLLVLNEYDEYVRGKKADEASSYLVGVAH